MYVLFDDAGKFLAGRVLSEAESSAQVELESGKRLKVKGANLLLRFESPAPGPFMAAAQTLSQSIELDLAWEFAPEGDFGFAELARDYFSDKASLQEQAAMLMRLFEAPHYFRRAGKGQFRKAPAEIVAQALAAIEKKKQQTAQIAQWAQDLGRSRLSTVYMPGYKVTMLPDALVHAYTLQEGRDCPALSLYLRFDEATLALLGSESRIESVPIASNLRHDQLDQVVTEAWLQAQGVAPDAAPSAANAWHRELAFLFRLAQALRAQREVVRGKPETFNRPDYNFKSLSARKPSTSACATAVPRWT